METKNNKWTLNEALAAAYESISLSKTYEVDLSLRLREDELLEHEANVTELDIRRSGQKQNLVDQKSKTSGQDSNIDKMNTLVVDIRNIVRSNNPTEEIKVAFGVGEKIPMTISGVTAAANIVKDGYTRFTDWSKNAGILEVDMTKIADLKTVLSNSGKVQDESVYTRKAKTMSKDVLHRVVEDEVTRLSAIGAHVFRESNPPLAVMFEELIPKSHRPPQNGNSEV